jgi:hypothetical protein
MSKNTIFTFKELYIGSNKTEANLLRSLSYAVSVGNIYRIRRGIYTKDKNYNILELATRIYTPAYISFETVLQASGVIFQNYTSVTVASYKTLDTVCDGHKIKYRKIKSTALLSQEGIDICEGYSMASCERAVLDMLYLYPKYYLDNLQPIDFKKIYQILPIYNNKRLEKEVAELYKKYVESK